MNHMLKHPVPDFGIPIIETHCHLDYLKDKALEDILELSRKSRIEKIITIAVAPDNLQQVMELSNAHEMVFGSQGVHPHEAKNFSTECAQQISSNLVHQKIVAVGEIGLDYYYEHSDRNIQKKVFEQQLQIAVDNNYPVIIHTRDADEDTEAILKNFSHTLKRKGVIHSFSSSKALAEFCLSENFYLGFNGMATFKKADNVREVIALCPTEQLLLETDAPYLTPVPYRGKENAPYLLPFIAEKIAEIKAIEVEKLLQACLRNSESLFWPR